MQQVPGLVTGLGMHGKFSYLQVDIKTTDKSTAFNSVGCYFSVGLIRHQANQYEIVLHPIRSCAISSFSAETNATI